MRYSNKKNNKKFSWTDR